MSSTNVLSDECTDVQEDEFEVVDETMVRESRLQATVSMEIAAKVDSGHQDGEYAGLTLAGEERARARELEIEKTSRRFDRRQDSGREARCREYVAGRTPSELWEARPEDPREEIEREALADVNQEADRLCSRVRGFSRAAISRMLAERVRQGADVATAVIHVGNRLQYGEGQVVPIGGLDRIEREEVSVEGVVGVLWTPSHPAIGQVGLLDDGTGRVKFTVWEKSNQMRVREGERVRIAGAALSEYEGRPNLAVTGWSDVRALDRDPWWKN